MHTQTVKESIHQLIDQIEDKALLLHYDEMLKKELKNLHDFTFFNADEAAMIARAKDALQSVDSGKTRNIEAFKKEVEARKLNRTM